MSLIIGQIEPVLRAERQMLLDEVLAASAHVGTNAYRSCASSELVRMMKGMKMRSFG